MALASFLDALLACGLPAPELAAKIRAKLPAADAGELEELITIAPPEKLQAVITAYVTGLVKAEKAEAKRKHDRENVATKRARNDMRDIGDIRDAATARLLSFYRDPRI